MVHDEGAEVLGVEQHVAHHARVGDGGLAVGEGDGAGPLEQADLGHLLALEPLGHRRHGVHVHDGVVAGAALDEIDERHLIDDRVGLRHDNHGGDAAGSGGMAGGLQRLAMLKAGLAGEHLRIDEPRGEDVPLAVDDGDAVGRVAAQMRADVGDEAFAHDEAARLVAVGRRIDDARVDESGRRRGFGLARGALGGGGLSVHRFGRLRASASSTAMRTATPIST